MPPNAPSLESSPLKALLSLPIPVYTSPVQQPPAGADTSAGLPAIPGGGLMRRLLESVPAGWAIPTASILQFVLEGDNRADAGYLAAVVAKVIGVDVAQWRQPGSWTDGLFGTPHDQSLYG